MASAEQVAQTVAQKAARKVAQKAAQRAARGVPLATWSAAPARRRRGGPAPAPALTAEQRTEVLDTFTALVEGLYAHLPLKRARYATDPLQRLRVLGHRSELLDDAQFHAQLAAAITGLRDAHTRYIGPAALDGWVAFLPFLVEGFGTPQRPRYLVSKVAAAAAQVDPEFTPGVELRWWNAVPIDRAVDRRADQETGGRPDSRRARAAESLTMRALRFGPPPDEHWVEVGYRAADGSSREARFDWRVLRVDVEDVLDTGPANRLAYALDSAAETVRAAKTMLYAPQVWLAGRTRSGRRRTAAAIAPEPGTAWLPTEFRDTIAARPVRTRAGTFGYLRLWSFNVADDGPFVDEVARLLGLLPQGGLIVDLRGNPGGLIPAAERLLQLFTPTPPVPTRFSFLATPLTRRMAEAPQNAQELAPWRTSLAGAVESGEPYSQAVPITSAASCYDVGQVYGGPVVAVVDANTYSAGDLFAAGFVDNEIGRLVTVGEATGAGGANVWYPEDVAAALAETGLAPRDLPAGIGYTISARRATRVGAAEGSAIEDVGVAGHDTYAMTRADLVGGNRDLFRSCAAILAATPSTSLSVERTDEGLAVAGTGLDRVDVLDGGRLVSSTDLTGGSALVPAPNGSTRLEVLGWQDDRLVQRRRVPTT